MSIDDPSQILATLKELASEKRLQDGATLSEDGTTLTTTATSTTYNAQTKCTITLGDKSCTYTAAAIYLQILDPNQRLLTYRNACKQHSVSDPIGAIDKAVVVGYFFGDSSGAAAGPDDGAVVDSAAAAATAAPAATEMAATASSDKRGDSSRKEHRHKSSSSAAAKDHHHRKESSSSSKRKRDHHHRSSTGSSKHHREGESDKKKKAKSTSTVTNEELLGNLDDMVGKRSTDPSSAALEADKAAITAALSAEGFDVTPELLDEYRESTQQLLANEIPVGDSASILRAANPRKDLSRVLEIFNETVNPKKSKPSSSSRMAGSGGAGTASGSAQKAVVRTHLVGKKPVIVVPKGLTAPLVMMNAHEFLAKGRYVPHDVMRKQQRESGRRPTAPTTFTRNVTTAHHSGLVEYEITDNPKRLLGPESKEWDRIVAVIVLGQKWQFADWFHGYSDPVRLFSKAFGFFVQLEGDKVPADVSGWAVRHAKLNRDKRGLDSVTSAAFWNGLDEFMSVHKRELLPQSKEE